jgi:carbamoyltransferase
MRVLSLHHKHDASLCVYNDGEIEKFFLSERLSKIKHDNNVNIIIKQLLSEFDHNSIDIKVESNFNEDHHIHHAALAFYNSGFEESLVVVADGAGAFIDTLSKKIRYIELETIYYAKYPDIFIPLYKNFNPSPISKSIFLNLIGSSPFDVEKIKEHFDFYKKHFDEYFLKDDGELKEKLNFEYKFSAWGMAASYCDGIDLLGEKNFEKTYLPFRAGKSMGLSSYGKRIPNFPKFIEDGLVKEFPRINYPIEGVSEVTKENYQPIADYCLEIQLQTQNGMCSLIEKAFSKVECENICISGGYGMNVVANHHYLKQFPNLNFYFEPLCDDGGQSIGQAMLHYRRITKDEKIYPLQTTAFHGINSSRYDVSKYAGEITPIKKVAEILSNNKSVAVYDGFPESGKRALGNRSILFNPLNPNAKELVNEIKKREWYRPFAASVLEEDASMYFEMGKIKKSPFMTVSFPVKTDIIPGVTHVDNTCRIQTVSKINGHLYELLLEFKKITGHGILLNTSFNLSGNPLVDDAEDALKAFKESCLDYLWFPETHYILDKS